MSASGNGTLNFKNGDVYEGEFKNSKPHGQGKMTFNNKDGRIYTGEWMKGKFHGKGVCTWPDGRWDCIRWRMG
jgi:hypothetical protein